MEHRVRFSELPCNDGQHAIAIATLDNPASLNALTLDMLQQLHRQLVEWQTNSRIACVVLGSTGTKAFCAGGDVRAMHHVMKEQSWQVAQKYLIEYFSLEYQCDYLIHTYRKPIIAWGEGIVMGGGMGLYMGASHKVVTPKSRLAMPEVSIGLYPDVGATWFLNKIDPAVGLFLGLTGTMINASDAIDIGFADHILLGESYMEFIQQLQISDWLEQEDHDELVTELLESFADHSTDDHPKRQIMPHLSAIQQACHGDDLSRIQQQILALETEDQWLKAAQASMSEGSPISAHICFRQLTQCQGLSLADCFRLELSLSVRCGELGEFQEGVRARLIDKDGEPNWLFRSVSEVDIAVIDNLFTTLWPQSQHPLGQLGSVS
jgi:enoyl-CoA hydratase/carnithine racemase